MTQGSQKTEGKPAFSASLGSVGSGFLLSKLDSRISTLALPLYTALCFSSKSSFTSWCGGPGHTLIRQKKKYFLLSSSVERQCEKIVGKDKLSKSARPVLENWFLANCNNFFWVLPMVLVPPPHFPPGCSSTVSKHWNQNDFNHKDFMDLWDWKAKARWLPSDLVPRYLLPAFAFL